MRHRLVTATALPARISVLVIPLSHAALADAILINNIRIVHTGEDPEEYFESVGPSGAFHNGLT